MKNTRIFLALASVSICAFSAIQGCSSDSTAPTDNTTATGPSTVTTGGGGGAGTTSTATGSTGGMGTGGTTSTTTGSTGGGGGSAFPPAPALGAQLDRFGRPAINTALNHAFDPDISMGGTKDTAKNAYNADNSDGTWAMTYTTEVAHNLAILDSLDDTCGNQFLIKQPPVKPAPAKLYEGLGSVLADDRMWLNTGGDGTCTTYLAVEATATMTIPGLDKDCGGRKLDYDVIDETYSLLAIGAPSGVTDGVVADADTKGTMFPYAADPH